MWTGIYGVHRRLRWVLTQHVYQQLLVEGLEELAYLAGSPTLVSLR
jgi:hypothetical protein